MENNADNVDPEYLFGEWDRIHWPEDTVLFTFNKIIFSDSQLTLWKLNLLPAIFVPVDSCTWDLTDNILCLNCITNDVELKSGYYNVRIGYPDSLMLFDESDSFIFLGGY